MTEIMITERNESDFMTDMRVAAVKSDGTVCSTGVFRYLRSSFGKSEITAMTAGGIATPVHFRRGGNVRKMFETMHCTAADEGAAVALLHPFSFSYYRQFGYEKVSDHVIVRFPTSKLDFVPRRCLLVPYDESKLADVLTVYNRFASGRNLLFHRFDGRYYQDPNKQIYVFYQDGVPTAYLTFSAKKELIVNHMGNGVVTVHEMCYTSPDGLREIFSFLRMFEGEYDEIELANIAPCPEAELLLRHYTHTTYRTVPDIMARVLNTEKMLLAAEYPQHEGRFTVQVEDTLPSVRGTFCVAYGGGKVSVTKTDACPDLTLTAPAFTRLIYGYDGASAAVASYMDGVQILGNAEDFFRAFPKKPCGVFEHF